jgi:hypothetical protein
MEAMREWEPSVPPTVYEDWLRCFDLLKSGVSIDGEVAETIARGSLLAGDRTAARFGQALAETVNEMLHKRIARFLKDLNMLISLNELAELAPLFAKFRGAVRACLFFTGLHFLDQAVREELERSVRTQTERFWDDTVTALRLMSPESRNADLEDSLFLIQRMNVFEKAI